MPAVTIVAHDDVPLAGLHHALSSSEQRIVPGGPDVGSGTLTSLALVAPADPAQPRRRAVMKSGCAGIDEHGVHLVDDHQRRELTE